MDNGQLPVNGGDVNINGTPAPSEERKQDILSAIFEWLELFVFSFALVLIVITFVARHSPVIGESMMNTLHENDLLIVSDMFYTPKQGDIIVFQSEATGYDEPYVKRIIATEGQVVDIDFNTWKVSVDGVVLDEPYVNYQDGPMLGSSYVFPLTVPKGKIFVMGDNRDYSKDSRDSRVGPVDARFILGRVIFRLYPFNRIGTVK